MDKPKWTPAQQQAIDARGGTLLVSAAAGSGKTAVLIERIVGRITDPVDPVDVSELLVVTFTRATAAEMKQRLAKGLSRAIAENPKNLRLCRQQMLLPTADITTVDGFCQKIVREHACTLGLPVDFKVADDAQVAVMKYDALDEAMENAYNAADPAFRVLSDSLNKKNDKPLSDTVLRLHSFLQVLPDPEEFVRRQNTILDESVSLKETTFGQALLTDIRGILQSIHAHLAEIDSLAREDVDRENTEKPPFFVTALRSAKDALAVLSAKESSFDDVITAASRFQKPKFSKTFFPEEAQAAAKSLYDAVGKLKDSLADYLDYSEVRLTEERRRLSPMIRSLFNVTADFDRLYAEKKLDAGLLDYNDLEHFALRLLSEKQDGVLVPSALAKELAASYREIYVDEYQDTNELQNTLYRLLSQEEQNLFFVGDAKQSIYGFRRTSPESFIKRRDNSASYDGEHFPATISLGHNFRSRENVTKAVNFLFDQLMQTETGGIAYAEGEQLVFGADYYPPDEQEICRPSLLLIDQAAPTAVNDNGEESADVYTLEARLIAKEIKHLMQTATVHTKNGPRPAQYGDFAILLRSTKGRDHLYAAELNANGIPAVTGSGDGNFFDATEIRWVMSLLRFIDNPLLDVSLLAVLMSPLYGFTPDEVAAIRQFDRRHSLYNAMRRTAKEETPLGTHCSDFLASTDAWRVLAATVPADRLLWHIYEQTDLPALCAIRENGAGREQNLQLLLERARTFEQNGFRGLSAFLRFFDRLQEYGQSMPTAAVSDFQDAVHIMTIHGSKGLEFPFVFVANIGKKFDLRDASTNVIAHDRAGVAMKWINDDTLERYDTILRAGVAKAILFDLRAEELRLLYVAATRAKEKLLFVGTLHNLSDALTGAALSLDESPKIPAGSVMRATSYSQWILAAMLRHPNAVTLRSRLTVKVPDLIEDDNPWDVRVFSKPEAEIAEKHVEQLPSADETLKAQLRERFAYRYPYEALSAVPVKLAASAVAHSARTRRYVATDVPAFLRKSGLTAAEKGTATHAFMQHTDWAVAAGDIETEKARLVAEEKLTAEQAAAINLDTARAFFTHPIYARIKSADNVWRELPFTYALSVADYKTLIGETAPDTDGESLLVQGIADCVFEEDGELVILDYKTDRNQTMEELRDHYAPQLKLYAKALAETLGKPVKSCLIYSFFNNDLIETDTEIT